MEELSKEVRNIIKSMKELGYSDKEIIEFLDKFSDILVKSVEVWKNRLKRITKEELEKISKRKFEKNIL